MLLDSLQSRCYYYFAVFPPDLRNYDGLFSVILGSDSSAWRNINNSNKASEAAASGSVAYPGQMGIADKRAVMHRFRKTVSAGPKNRTVNTVTLSRAIKAVGRNAFTARPSPVTVSG